METGPGEPRRTHLSGVPLVLNSFTKSYIVNRADSILSATAIAPNAADAGALATAFSVMTPAESRRLAAAIPGVEYLLIKKDGARVESPDWRTLAFPVPPPKPQESAAPGWELTVDLELARIDGRYKRPYVAVWIEDKDRFPVRTVALWTQKPRYLPEMKAWCGDDRARAAAEGTEISASVSSATRSSGRYTLKWRQR